MVTIPRLNLISSSLYYVVRQLSPATALPATLQAKELPLVLHSPLVAAAHKNTLRLALIYSDEVVLEQAFNVATDLRWEEGGVVAFQVTRVVLPIPVRYAFASADARELYAMLAGAITPAPGGAPPPQPPPPASALTLGPAADGDSLRPDSWEAADPSFAQLRLPRRGLGESDQGPTRGARILSESDVHLLRPLSPQAPGGSPPAALVATSSSGDVAAVHAGTLEEAQRDELDAAVTALAATEQCVWGLSPDATLVWDSLTGALLERRRLTSEAATHLLCVGSQMWLFAPHLISVYAARLLEPVPDRAAALVALLPSAGRRDWRPMHVVLRSTELAVYRRREDLETAYRMPLKGATFQRSTHADHKFVLLVREAAPVGSKASALLGMSAEPLLLAARSDEELSAWHAAVAAACAAIDTGRCQFLRTAELGCRTVGAVVEAEGRVWVAAGERAVVRVFDAVSGAFRAEYLYIPPEHAPNELISCVWCAAPTPPPPLSPLTRRASYHKEYMWAGLGRDIVRASPVDFGQRKSFSAGRSRVYHLVPQDNFLWRYVRTRSRYGALSSPFRSAITPLTVAQRLVGRAATVVAAAVRVRACDRPLGHRAGPRAVRAGGPRVRGARHVGASPQRRHRRARLAPPLELLRRAARRRRLRLVARRPLARRRAGRPLRRYAPPVALAPAHPPPQCASRCASRSRRCPRRCSTTERPGRRRRPVIVHRLGHAAAPSTTVRALAPPHTSICRAGLASTTRRAQVNESPDQCTRRAAVLWPKAVRYISRAQVRFSVARYAFTAAMSLGLASLLNSLGSSHSQPFSTIYRNRSTWPFSAARRAHNLLHMRPCSLSHSSTSTCPLAAACSAQSVSFHG